MQSVGYISRRIVNNVACWRGRMNLNWNVRWSHFVRRAFGLVLTVTLSGSYVGAQESQIDFDRQIRPLLSDRCYFCHGPDANRREADLRLDEQEAALAVIEPGHPADSELVRRIESDDASEVMPPPESKISLTDHERDLIKAWIKQGADWKQHWAFQKRVPVQPPPVNQVSRVRNAIDQFVLRKLEQEALQLAPEASREKLIRRATFDLTGLPPTLEEVDTFLADKSRDAYEKMLDRLLASEHYGQRMASDWLDIARYSDTYGYQVDRDRYVWPWRDWVIRAFNQNKPYDQFVIEQLAGDLLPNATDDQILATTFNRLHPQKVEGGSVEEEFRVEYVADRTHTFGTAFLGLTLECARCHDHKFDPISQKEYYQLFAYFNNIDEAGLYSYFTPSVPTPTLDLTTPQDRQALRTLRSELKQALAEPPAEVVSQDVDWARVIQQMGADPIEGVDFENAKLGKNQKIKDPRGNAGVKLTGDDPVNLKQGNFRRFQPFSVVLSLMTPDDKSRAVIYHRSRAWTDAASRGYQLLIEDGKLSASLIHFWPGNAIRVVTREKIPTGKWLDVAVVYDGSSQAAGLSIFVNGMKQPVDIVRDRLTRKITGGGGDHLAIGQRFRDRGFTDGSVSSFAVYDRDLSSLEVAYLHDPQTKRQLQRAVEQDRYTVQQLRQLEKHLRFDRRFKPNQAWFETIQKLRQAICDKQDGLSEIMVMRELPQPRQAYVLDRGMYDQRRDPVGLQTPQVLPPWDPSLPRNRLGLAKWLTAPDHPLTARVTVNHYWQLLFGEGIVRTPEDFGRQSALPTHPELLDWLASEFVKHDWDIHWLLKTIMLSATYRQSSAVTEELLQRDPDNELLARAPSFRMPAEMLRDNVLAISGLLVDKLGGPPVRPYELAASFKPSAPDTGEGLYRRSLYTYWKRTGPAPVMLALDAAKRDVCRVKRERTSSPLQALAMLNGPQFVEASRALAYRLLQEDLSDMQRGKKLFRLLTSRSPNAREAEIVGQLLAKQQDLFQKHPEEAAAYLQVGNFGAFAVQPIAWIRNKHPYRLGADQLGGSRYAGEIAQARIFKTKATAEDVRAWYQSGREDEKRDTKQVVVDLATAELVVSGDVDKKRQFRGGFLELKKSNAKQLGNQFTLELWVNPASQGGRLWDKITPGKADGFLLDLHQGLRFICGGHTVMADRVPPTGQWSHIVVTVDRKRAEVAFYLNGVPNGVKKHPTSIGDVDPVQLAAWASVVNTLINHDECVTRR